MSCIKDTIETIKENRNRILEGKVNCIPSPFERFRSEFPGISPKRFYLVSGATKAGKTQLTSFLFIYNTLLYAYENPDKVNPKIFYYNLEEDEEDINLRFMSHLLYKLSNIYCSPDELQSIDERNPLSKDIIEVLESEEYKKIFKFYEDHVVFQSSRNPTGVYKDMKSYAETHGVCEYEECKYTDENGITQTGQKFKKYIPNDENEYVIIIIDHISLIESERGMTKKEAMDKLSEYCVTLRNRYSYIPVVCQQQNIESTGLEAFKANKIRPTMAGLADSKNTGKDCTVMLGITNPASFDKEEYLGYDITVLNENFRCLEIVLNRKGKSNSICPLYFDGAINFYKELPKPSDRNEMNKVYNFVSNKRVESNTKKGVLNLLLIKHKIKNDNTSRRKKHRNKL